VFDEIDRVLRPGGRLQIADVVIHHGVSADARKRIDLWTGRIAGPPLHGEHARLLVQRGYIDISQGALVDTYARSAFEDTRRKAAKFRVIVRMSPTRGCWRRSARRTAGAVLEASRCARTVDDRHRRDADHRAQGRALTTNATVSREFKPLIPYILGVAPQRGTACIDAESI
jgi:hypothetical protein